MKTKTCIIPLSVCITILFTSIPAVAQLSDFKLDQYTLPDIKRKQLDLNVNAYLNQYNYSANHYKSLNGNGTTTAAYSSYTNLKTYQGTVSSSLGLVPAIYRTKQDTYENLNKSFSSTFIYDMVNRFYIKDKFFLEADINSEIQYSTGKNYYKYFDANKDLTSRNDYTNTGFNVTVEVPLLAGYGRIERVEDARLALYILEDLQKLGRLTRTPSDEEIFELASLISTKKNERFFDSRIQKIEEIKAIDAFLAGKGLISQADAVYFTSMNDNWDYSAGPERLSGYRIYGGLVPSLTPDISKNTNLSRDGQLDTISYSKTDQRTFDRSLAVEGGVTYDKPLNHYWQFEAGANLEYTFLRSTINEKITDSKTKSKVSDFVPVQFVSIGYYPNSRTYAQMNLQCNELFATDYGWNTPDDKWEKSSTFTQFNISLGFQWYYYISPQLRFRGSYGLSVAENSTKPINQSKVHTSSYSNNITLGLVYSIF